MPPKIRNRNARLIANIHAPKTIMGTWSFSRVTILALLILTLSLVESYPIRSPTIEDLSPFIYLSQFCFHLPIRKC